MPRNMRSHEGEKNAKAKRSFALRRNELRQPSHPREAPAGPISMPIKVVDAATAAMIREFLEERGGRK